MPWISRATAIKPDNQQIGSTMTNVKGANGHLPIYLPMLKQGILPSMPANRKNTGEMLPIIGGCLGGRFYRHRVRVRTSKSLKKAA